MISFVHLKYVIFLYGRHVLHSLNVFLIYDYDYACLYVMIKNGNASWDSVRRMYELELNNMRVRIFAMQYYRYCVYFPFDV